MLSGSKVGNCFRQGLCRKVRKSMIISDIILVSRGKVETVSQRRSIVEIKEAVLINPFVKEESEETLLTQESKAHDFKLPSMRKI